MYKNYKISGDGTPKYDGGGYRIAPERRFKESTDEWQKRVNGDTRLRRRKPVKKNSGIKVIYLLYVFIFLAIFWIVDTTSDSANSKMAINNPNSNLKNYNLVVNNTRVDFGNELNYPSDGNKFLYVDTTLENLSNASQHIDSQDFTLICNDDQEFKPINIKNQSNDNSSDLNNQNNLSQELTFEIPMNYSGDIRLEFNMSD